MNVSLKVFGPRGDEKIVDLCKNEEDLKRMTVLQLKDNILKRFKIDSEIRVVFRTEKLEESSLVSDYGIKHMSTIHTILILPGGVKG